MAVLDAINASRCPATPPEQALQPFLLVVRGEKERAETETHAGKYQDFFMPRETAQSINHFPLSTGRFKQAWGYRRELRNAVLLLINNPNMGNLLLFYRPKILLWPIAAHAYGNFVACIAPASWLSNIYGSYGMISTTG